MTSFCLSKFECELLCWGQMACLTTCCFWVQTQPQTEQKWCLMLSFLLFLLSMSACNTRHAWESLTNCHHTNLQLLIKMMIKDAQTIIFFLYQMDKKVPAMICLVARHPVDHRGCWIRPWTLLRLRPPTPPQHSKLSNTASYNVPLIHFLVLVLIYSLMTVLNQT